MPEPIRADLSGKTCLVTGANVGIGKAVAKTMAVALVVTVVVNALLTQVFWGTNPNLPIQI